MYAVREEEALRPPAEFPYLELSQVCDGRCDEHGSIHETTAIIGQDQIPASVTRGPVGVAHTRHGAVVNNKGFRSESPNGIRSITEVANHDRLHSAR
jgi:hypothetical protein